MLTLVTWAGIFIVCGLYDAVFTLEGYSLLVAIVWLPKFLFGSILMFLTVSRVAAAEFTFFLAVPTMLGASAFKLLKFGFEFTSAELLALVLGMAVAFAVSVLVIKFLMNFIKKHDFKVFGWYRIVLGILVVLIKS